MLNTALAIVKNGKIETLEHIELPEGKKGADNHVARR